MHTHRFDLFLFSWGDISDDDTPAGEYEKRKKKKRYHPIISVLDADYD